MIQGVGTDIVDIERIARIYARHGDAFVLRILSDVEYRHLQSIASQKQCLIFLAERFALKEAVAKALGTGIGSELSFQDITVKTHGLVAITSSNPSYETATIHYTTGVSDPFVSVFVVIER